ncbi:hypothetical protein ACFL6R_07475 [Gemmatimonadota bacterium]
MRCWFSVILATILIHQLPTTARAQEYPNSLWGVFFIKDSIEVDLDYDGEPERIFINYENERRWNSPYQITLKTNQNNEWRTVWEFTRKYMSSPGWIGIDDTDKDGFNELWLLEQVDQAFSTENRLHVIEFSQVEGQKLRANLVLETKNHTKVLFLGQEHPYVIVVLRHFSPPHRRPYDTPPWYEWAALIEPNRDGSGFRLANEELAPMLMPHLETAQEHYRHILSSYNRNPSRALAEEVLNRGCDVLLWYSTLLDETGMLEWYRSQIPVFREFQQYKDAFWISDSGHLLPLDPVDTLQQMYRSAVSRIEWIIETWGIPDGYGPGISEPPPTM